MPTPTLPPSYPFAFVLEHPQQGLDSRQAQRVPLYEEAARTTHDILLMGRRRALVFVVRPNSRLALFKRGWHDRTEAFRREWAFEDGAWKHTAPEPSPAPITAPDRRRDPPKPEPEEGPLDLPVKQLQRLLRTGALDAKLDELLATERAAPRPRGGAVAALLERQAELAAGTPAGTASPDPAAAG